MMQSDEGRGVRTLVARTAYDDGRAYEIPAGTIGTIIVGGGGYGSPYSGADVEFSVLPPEAVSDLEYDFPVADYKDHELELVDD